MGQREINAVVGLLGMLFSQKDERFEEALRSQHLDTEAPLRYELRDLSFTEHTRVVRLKQGICWPVKGCSQAFKRPFYGYNAEKYNFCRGLLQLNI